MMRRRIGKLIAGCASGFGRRNCWWMVHWPGSMGHPLEVCSVVAEMMTMMQTPAGAIWNTGNGYAGVFGAWILFAYIGSYNMHRHTSNWAAARADH